MIDIEIDMRKYVVRFDYAIFCAFSVKTIGNEQQINESKRNAQKSFTNGRS